MNHAHKPSMFMQPTHGMLIKFMAIGYHYLGVVAPCPGNFIVYWYH